MRKINSKLTFFACSLMVLFWFLIMAAIFAPNQYVKLDLDLKFNTNGEEIGIYFDDKPEIYIRARKKS